MVKLKETEGQWSSREKEWQNNKIRLEQELHTKTDMVRRRLNLIVIVFSNISSVK